MAENTAHLEGELSFATVDRWLPQLGEMAGSGTVDLSRVTRADSAGLALLLELSRGSAGALRFTGANAQVRGLIEFFELEAVLKTEGA